MRSGADHLMFIDSDIGFNPQDVIALMALQIKQNDMDIVGGPYPKKSVAGNCKIETEDGEKTLKWIVKNKYSGKVKSLSDDNKIRWNNVVQWNSEPNKYNKNWVKFKLQNNKRTPIITYDHECAAIENIFKPKVEYVVAEKMKNLFSVRDISNTPHHEERGLYNTDQLSFAIGTSLGDGYIDTSYNLGFNHGHKQKEYIEFKQELLKGTMGISSAKGGYSTVPGYYLRCPTNTQIRELRSLIYDGKQKTIKNVLEYMNDISLAAMYMDDGTLQYCTSSTKQYPYFKLHTESFTYDDNVLFCEWFKEKYNVTPKIDIKEKGKYSQDFYILRFNVADSATIFKRIAKYIIPSMDYKIPQQYQETEKYNYDCKPMEISSTKVVEVNYISNQFPKVSNSDLYDIGVEEDHNFIVDGAVVHNCISWEKIKLAVDKGVADQDPNVLDRFVGDFVFNPKSNQANIPIGEPCEVLEIGTGFMMITKDAMNKYYEAYKETHSYLPDHVRTEHFDGSREILMFFQAAVDPKTKRYLSEDYYFCQMAQEIGLKTWLCPWMKLQHVGTFIFGGSLADLASISASATCNPDSLNKKKTK